MIQSDKAIEKRLDDKLGRANFAMQFSKSLLAYAKKESLVTGLYGEWGSGKTSVINMVAECIEDQTYEYEDEKKPIIIKFNPWNYSDQSHLIALFFKEVAFALQREDYGDSAKNIGEKLEAYANFFTPLALIPDPSVNIFSVITQKAISSVGKAARAWGTAYSKDLEEMRKTLKEDLTKLDRKIVIIIDDIDRLPNNEISQIFQLVKMVGDFPNTIYLLSFDFNVVSKALNKVQEGSGVNYLEKIVQFSVQIPAITRSDLEKFLFSGLDELLKTVPNDYWNQGYWSEVYDGGVKDFVVNIRDVMRYLNSLSFKHGMVKDTVNFVDLIAITALSVFEPLVYQGVRSNKDLFTGEQRAAGLKPQDVQELKTRCDEIVERAERLKSGKLIELLTIVFPKLDDIYDGGGYGSEYLGDWRKIGRICHPENFDTYFSLELPEGEFPKSEMNALIALSEDAAAFGQMLSGLNQSGRIVRFLDLLSDYTQDIKEEFIGNVVTALMEQADQFPHETQGMFERDSAIKVSSILHLLTQRIESQAKRFEIYRGAIQNIESGIYTAARKISVFRLEHGKGETDKALKSMESRTVDDKQLEQLETILLEKIAVLAEAGELQNEYDLCSILWRWKQINEERGLITHREFANTLIGTDAGLVRFITEFTGKARVYPPNEDGSTVDLKINPDDLKEFIDYQGVEERIKVISKSENYSAYTEDEKAAISNYIDTINGKKEIW